MARLVLGQGIADRRHTGRIADRIATVVRSASRTVIGRNVLTDHTAMIGRIALIDRTVPVAHTAPAGYTADDTALADHTVQCDHNQHTVHTPADHTARCSRTAVRRSPAHAGNTDLSCCCCWCYIAVDHIVHTAIVMWAVAAAVVEGRRDRMHRTGLASGRIDGPATDRIDHGDVVKHRTDVVTGRRIGLVMGHTGVALGHIVFEMDRTDVVVDRTVLSHTAADHRIHTAANTYLVQWRRIHCMRCIHHHNPVVVVAGRTILTVGSIAESSYLHLLQHLRHQLTHLDRFHLSTAAANRHL